MSKKRKNLEVGTCLRYIDGEQVFRSKFRTPEDAQEKYESLLYINVVNPNYIVYKCPECSSWHFGKKEWSK